MTFKKTAIFALILAAVTVVYGTIYAATQQVYRQLANDPQIQVAEDTAAALDAGKDASTLIDSTKVDLQKSQASFVIIYDANHNPLATSAVLSGDIPTPQVGVFDHAKTSGENRVTWQPQSDVRIAAVVRPFKDGYVLAGRSLRANEERTTQLTQIVGLSWFVTVLGAVVGFVLLASRKKIAE